MENEIKQEIRPATKKQLWALFCITKKDYRNINISFDEASKIISESKNNPVQKEKKERKAKQTFEQEVWNFLLSKISIMSEQLKRTTSKASVIMNDTNFVKDDGKRYVFFGVGCSIGWIDFRKNNKKAIETMTILRKLEDKWFDEIIKNAYDSAMISKFNQVGSPLIAIMSQDYECKQQVLCIYAEFMRSKNIKCKVEVRID